MHSFIFTESGLTLTACGVAQEFDRISDANEYLYDGLSLIVGALPFHRADAPRLFAPREYKFSSEPVTLESPDALPAVASVDFLPPLSVHQQRIEQCIAEIQAGTLDKLVLSRAERFHFTGPVNPEAVLAGYMASAGTGFGYLVELAGGEFFIGPSPEVLIKKQGREISSFPLAGTAMRSTDPELDRAIAANLQASEKDLHEHSFVTAGIREALAPLCTQLEIPAIPLVMHTAHTWHLGTPIRGILRQDVDMSALDLAQLLHPTAAVNGHPAQIAAELLAKQEPDRGFYSGAVGWANGRGDGEWRVGIRSALISGDTVTAYAGGGIVADSVAADELQETHTKLGPIRSALGIL